MLNRRDFLRHGGTGLSGVALLSLLAEQKLLAAKDPWRPQWSPEHPFVPRAPHFAAKAKNVVVIFCSGALSHLEVVGNGHFWGGGHPYASGAIVGGTMSRQLDTSQAVVDFFVAHGR